MTAGSEFQVLIVETPSLGDRSYVVHDGAARHRLAPSDELVPRLPPLRGEALVSGRVPRLRWEGVAWVPRARIGRSP